MLTHAVAEAQRSGLACHSRYTGEDDAVTEVYNNEAPVSGLGFFGDAPAAHAFCTCFTSRASVLAWPWPEACSLATAIAPFQKPA